MCVRCKVWEVDERRGLFFVNSSSFFAVVGDASLGVARRRGERGRRTVVMKEEEDAWTYVFDLDGTLYPIANGYESACRTRVFEFMVKHCPGVETVEEARSVWSGAFRRYNQTLRALRSLGFDGFDEEEYWAYTRSDAKEALAPVESTRSFVESLRGKKYVFTNCHEKQAKEALVALGLSDCFDGVFGAGDMGAVCKPEPAAFDALFSRFDVRDPSRCVFFEDSLKNLRTANRSFDMVTVLIASDTLTEEIDARAASPRPNAAADDDDDPTAFVDAIVRGGELTIESFSRASFKPTERAVEACADALRGARAPLSCT